jgi:peptidoglycan hydrolase CwlO-like protein
MTKKTKHETKRAPKSIARPPTKPAARRTAASKNESALGAIETQLHTIEDRLDKIETDIKEIKPKLDQVYKDMAEVLDVADKIAAMRARIDEMFEFYTNNRASEPLKDAL